MMTTEDDAPTPDLTGLRFRFNPMPPGTGVFTILHNRLALVSRSRVGDRPAWVCRCFCGTVTAPITEDDLARGRVTSCGCIRDARREAAEAVRVRDTAGGVS